MSWSYLRGGRLRALVIWVVIAMNLSLAGLIAVRAIVPAECPVGAGGEE